MRTQLVDGLLADLLQDVRFLRVYPGIRDHINNNAKINDKFCEIFYSCFDTVSSIGSPKKLIM